MDTMSNVIYKAFGLTIASDFELPELEKTSIREHEISNIVIIKADLSDIWLELSTPNSYYVVKDSFVMLHVPNVAIYLVKNGEEIFVSPISGAVNSQIRLYILGSCMGAILMQRKVLPLHGSAVVINDKAYAIVGESGVGKSTLASAFMERGYELLSDDVIPIYFSEEGIPVVSPAYPQQKLWLDSLNYFGMESSGLQPIVDRKSKYFVPVLDLFAVKEVPIEGVFELVKMDIDSVEISSVECLERLHTLFNHTYRNFLIPRLGMTEWHFKISTKIVNEIKLYQLRRPISHFTATDLVDTILAKIKKGEQVV